MNRVDKDKLDAILDDVIGEMEGRMPVRIQITQYEVLVAECVVEAHMQYKTWAAFAKRKYAKGLPIGGASMQRADLPRMWNVPVGSQITDKD